MNPLMQQGMLPYQMIYTQRRTILPNQPQFVYQQYPTAFYPRIPIQPQIPINPITPLMTPQNLNQPQPQPQPQIQVQNDLNKESNSVKGDTNTTQPPMPILSKYKDIYVPTIFLLDYNDTSKPPFNTFVQSQTQQMQIQSPNMFNKYFNYNYNFDQWKNYVNEIRGKFDELNELVKSKTIILPEPDNVLEYLMAFPSDFGGLGEIREDQKYESVKFYDPKDKSKNPEGKSFMEMIKFEHDTWFPLEPKPQSLNKYINNGYNNINSVIPPKNFLNPILNPTPFVSKNDNTLGNNTGAKQKEINE